MDNATYIPSRVLRLPPPLPLLPPGHPHRRRWAAVLPSPDRSAVLLRGQHECQLISMAGFTHSVSDTSGANTSSACLRPHAEPRAPSSLSVAAAPSTGASSRVLLPQPHRVLTASCWLSAGMGTTSNAMVALGDACAALTVMRCAPSSQAAATASSTVAWAQTTIFLHDSTADSDDIADFVAHRKRVNTETCTAWHRCRRLEGAASAVVSPSTTAGWKAVTALVPCNYVTAPPPPSTMTYTSATTRSQPLLPSQPPVDAHLLCQRAGDGLYAGNGTAGAGRSLPRATAWMAAVQRESAWRVPLAMPPGEEASVVEDASTGLGCCESGMASGDAAPAVLASTTASASRLRISAELTRCTTGGGSSREDDDDDVVAPTRMRRLQQCAAPQPRPTSSAVRLLDVRRQPSATVGPMGLVVAAAMRRHVGLYTTAGTSVAPTVFFPLPVDPNPHPPSRCRPRNFDIGWRVASILEAPAVEATSNSFSYLVTLTARGGISSSDEAGPLVKAERREDEEDGGSGDVALRGGRTVREDRWWLLYDCRNPSVPVWAADAASGAWGLCDGSVYEELDEAEGMLVDSGAAPVHTEWLSSAGPSLCAAYVPDRSATASVSRGGGTCVVLDGGLPLHRSDGGGALRVSDSDADGTDGVDEDNAWCATMKTSSAATCTADSAIKTRGDGVRLPAPIMYELSPPRSVVRVADVVDGVGAGAATASSVCVRALAYVDGVLHYICDDAAV